MSRRSFPCGHNGKGQYCHRCKQERDQAKKEGAERQRQLAEHRADKVEWAVSFVGDEIDLRPLQTRERVLKARELLRRLAAGEIYTSLGGKRWESDRTVVSVPIGWGYRLVLRDEGGSLRPHSVMTHEEYNGLRPGQLGGRRG